MMPRRTAKRFGIASVRPGTGVNRPAPYKATIHEDGNHAPHRANSTGERYGFRR